MRRFFLLALATVSMSALAVRAPAAVSSMSAWDAADFRLWAYIPYWATNTQITNQNLVEQMLSRQRDSVSGVSLDEEMTDLIKFQKAFEASARLIVTIDEMLETVVNLKR